MPSYQQEPNDTLSWCLLVAQPYIVHMLCFDAHSACTHRGVQYWHGSPPTPLLLMWQGDTVGDSCYGRYCTTLALATRPASLAHPYIVHMLCLDARSSWPHRGVPYWHGNPPTPLLLMWPGDAVGDSCYGQYCITSNILLFTRLLCRDHPNGSILQQSTEDVFPLAL